MLLHARLETMSNEASEAEGEFHPKGAVAFFAGLIAFFAVIWLALYALMLHRR